MFNEKNKSSNKIATLIGEQCNIVGSLNGTGLLQIDGYVDGDIYWDEDITIGETCTCKGNVTCNNAYINGKIIGNITCKGSLILECTGQIEGDILVGKLIIKEGGVLDGKCSMVVPEYSQESLTSTNQSLCNTYD